MIAFKLEEDMELRIWLLGPMLIYPTHFGSPIIPNVAPTEHNNY